LHSVAGRAGRSFVSLLAVQIARYPGARKIIVTGRNPQAVAQAGGDVAICLNEDDTSLREQLAAIRQRYLDYLWGTSAENILMAAAKTKSAALCAGRFTFRRRNLPGAFLRSAPIQLMGRNRYLTLSQLLTATQSLFATPYQDSSSLPARRCRSIMSRMCGTRMTVKNEAYSSSVRRYCL
jgi:threonine dehydrogenase-like Zn-dependent dehydrogenase